MTPIDTYVHHKNPSVNLSEIYQGVDLVQLSDHENDQDDIVPELSEAVQAASEVIKAKPYKKDFAGEDYEETYDEWAKICNVNDLWDFDEFFIIFVNIVNILFKQNSV